MLQFYTEMLRLIIPLQHVLQPAMAIIMVPTAMMQVLLCGGRLFGRCIYQFLCGFPVILA